MNNLSLSNRYYSSYFYVQYYSFSTNDVESDPNLNHCTIYNKTSLNCIKPPKPSQTDQIMLLIDNFYYKNKTVKKR